MDMSFLPRNYLQALNKVDLTSLSEIRMRENFPVKVKIKNIYYYLTNIGLSILNENSIICNNNDINYVIRQVTEHSIYAFNERIKNGYITTTDGVRIGLAGECVFEQNKITTIKNFTSLNIRIPHEVFGCSRYIFQELYKNENVLNSLIISPPARGKTTMLKDLALTLNKNNLQILIIDERGEFSNILGENIDKIMYSDKNYAFDYGIRSLSPSVVITDELSSEFDWKCAQKVTNSGVKIIASCHAENIKEVKSKQYYIDGVFERYFVLKKDGQVGVLDSVWSEEFIKL